MNFPIIQQHQDLHQAVSARELHDFLEMTERFSSWFDRMLAYGFSEFSDFEKCKTFNASNRELEDYFISIDMAKEISMIQRSEKGKQARQYFLECERKLNDRISMPAVPQSFSEALLLAGTLQQKIEQDAPKVNAFDKLIDSKNLKSVGNVAKSIGLKSAQALNKKLEAVKAYDGRCGNRVWSGWFVEQGLGEMRTTDDGYSRNLITAKGQAWALDLFGN